MLEECIANHLPDARRFLCDVIRIPSMSGQEIDAMDYVRAAFSPIASSVEKIPISNSIRDDGDYSYPVEDLTYDNRFNVRVVRRGAGDGPTAGMDRR